MSPFQFVGKRWHRVGVWRVPELLRIVESFRDPVTKRPKLRVLRHLGRADDALALLNSADPLELQSRAHGAVAAVWQMAQRIDFAAIIDGALPQSRREDGLSVGASLTLAAVGRACHATSKRGFAAWADTTTLGDLAMVDVTRLTSQHFWDQMHQIPVTALAKIESALITRVVAQCARPVDTLLYDATNFFTFLASTNQRATLPARGHNKQKRHDLRQVGVALCCTRADAIPLFHAVYGGERPDVRVFADVFPKLRERFVALGSSLETLTVIYDKGNVSKATQAMVDQSARHYVAALTAASQRAVVHEATPQMEPLVLRDDETVTAYRTRREVWGADRTLVVVCSPRLQAGQRRGIEQHLASAGRWLDALKDTLARGHQRRTRVELEMAIKARLRRQHLADIPRVELSGRTRQLTLTYTVDRAALDTLERTWLGRLVLMTDQHHWTDPKLHVPAFLCVIAFLLATLVHRTARHDADYRGSVDALFQSLTNIRRVTVVRSNAQGRLQKTEQLEQLAPEHQPLLDALGITR